MSAAFASARCSSVILATRREDARRESVRVIRAIEAKTVEALNGERLRGLPNIGTRSDPFYAARVLPAGKVGRMPKDSRSVLAVGVDGRLIVVASVRGSIEFGTVSDDELVSEDLAPYTRLVANLLERHALLSDRRIGQLTKAYDLALRLFAALEEIEIDATE